MVAIVLIASATAFSFTAPVERYFDIAKSLDIFATLFKEVNAFYVDEIDPESLVNESRAPRATATGR